MEVNKSVAFLLTVTNSILPAIVLANQLKQMEGEASFTLTAKVTDEIKDANIRVKQGKKFY